MFSILASISPAPAIDWNSLGRVGGGTSGSDGGGGCRAWTTE